MAERTIAAIATARGEAGIAVIRVSGAEAIEICDRIFKGRAPLRSAASHTLHYGHIISAEDENIDEVMAAVMLSPRTFTGEDTVEISTHGGRVAPARVLRALFEAGAAPAQPGEFTKRAFLNGRIDLSRAEAVIDIITSKTELEQKNALAQSEGQLSGRIDAIRGGLLRVAAAMQVAIDYPDEDLEDMTREEILAATDDAVAAISRLSGSATRGKILREGIKTAIVGRPNVGKSSLLNCLALEERAIVTDIAGTTRDTIEESVELGGIMLRLCDTAGIHKTDDTVEKLGVERAQKSMEAAQLVLLVLDASTGLLPEDEELLERTKDMRRIVLINKADIQKPFELDGAIGFSAKSGIGTDKLAARIGELFDLADCGESDPIVTNERHTAALLRARDALLRAKDALLCGLEQDFAALDINEAIHALGEIDGRTVSEDIVNEVFKNFCVGK